MLIDNFPKTHYTPVLSHEKFFIIKVVLNTFESISTYYAVKLLFLFV